MKKIFQVIIILLYFLSTNSTNVVFGQDSHMSQFSTSPIIMNPSYAGSQEKGDIRVVSQFRNQWNSVANKLSTTTLAVDIPFQQKWGLGGYIINYDAAKSFNVFNFVVSAAYDIASKHQKKHKINMGLQLGLIYKSTSNDKLVFDNQYVDGTFNTDLPSGENITKVSTMMPEVNYGISYQNIEHRKKFKPYGGISVFHLTHPKESFIKSQDSKLPLRYVFIGGGKIIASDELIFDPKILIMRQKNAMEINVGFDGEYMVQPNTVSVLWGVYYRFKDAIIPMIGIDYKSILFKMSYDVNISTLKPYSNGKGGIEFSLTFLGGKQHRYSTAK